MPTGGYSNVFRSASADNLSHPASDDDFTKHSKVKRLSLETNRRRRELANRLKKEAEKEEKRKKEILEQRREKQRQATEKFQRSFSARTRRSPQSRSPVRGQTSELDAMLHLIRTGAPLHRVSSWDSVRHHAWPSQSEATDSWVAQESNNSSQPSPAFDKPPVPVARRTVFEQHLAERQEKLAMDQCRSLAEFSQVVESAVGSPPTPRDSLEAPQAPEKDDEDKDSLLDEAMFRPAAGVSHIRFVVDKEEEDEAVEDDDETIVEDLENGEPSVKSILKKKSAYSVAEKPGKTKTAGTKHSLAGDVLRDSIEITRVHMEQRSPPESPTPTRRKTVRFAEQLCEELRSPPRSERGTTDIPSPKPRRVYGSYASSGATAPSQSASNVSKPPAAPTRLVVTRRVVNKPPAHPGASSPGRPNQKPEKITSAALSKIGASSRDPDVMEIEEEQPVVNNKAPASTVVTVIPSANNPTLVISSDAPTAPPPAPHEEVSVPASRSASMEPSGARLPSSSLAQAAAEDTANVKSHVNGTAAAPDVPENYPLDRTPTEADIEWLWAKVRSCLQRPGSGNPSVAGSVGGDSQTNSELSIQSAPARPVVPMSSQSPEEAERQHVIDGTSIYPPNFVRNHYRISRHDGHNTRLVHHTVTPHARRVALIRQREMNQHLNRPPVSANNNNSEAVSMPANDASMSESMADFLVNEKMCQQSHLFNNTNSSVTSNQGLLNPVMGSILTPQQESPESRRTSNSQILSQTPQNSRPSPSPSPNLQSRRRVFLREQYKPHSLQQHTTVGSYTFTPHPPPARRVSAGPSGGKRMFATSNGYRPVSTLSVEEQRLMKSLERINDKLKATTLMK